MTPRQVLVKPILLVDDDEHHTELVVEALRAGGLTNRIISVETGQAALEYFFHNANSQQPRWNDLRDCPCLVILDLRLPDMEGLAVLKRLKQDRVFELIPVMILTTSADERDIKRGYDLQANAYLTKPVDFKEFAEKVRQAGIFWVLINEPAPM
jgi:CheY-like chemotaxis protein